MTAPDSADPRDDDAALLAAYAAGDQSAARSLVTAHAPRILGLARRMLGNEADAEEVTQEAMLRLWRIAPDWRAGEAKVSTWLYRVAANLCTDRLRRRRTVPLEPVHEPPDDGPSAEAGLIQTDRVRLLEQAIAGLPTRQRLAIVLRYVEERPNPEVAEILALSVEAVESLLARGRRTLKSRLADQQVALSYKDA